MAFTRARPTSYAGILFRSRAEARWASFFDLVGWSWQYEPVDLKGYIPDFIIQWHQPMLVEVKGGALSLGGLIGHRDKIEASGWDGDVLLVGAMPFDDLRYEELALGLYMQHLGAHGDERHWGTAPALAMCCSGCDRSFYHPIMSFKCPRCGLHEGDHHLGHWHSALAEWRSASARVSWDGDRRGRRRRRR